MSIEPVRVGVTVAVPREHAFAVFTERFDTWWPRSHHTGGGELAEAVIEPWEGGRWYEVRTDGSRGEWGRVVTWRPPELLVLAWQLGADFTYDPGLVTEVAVTFTAEGPHRTRVALEHRGLEAYAQRGDEMRGVFDGEGGWPGLLRAFVDTAVAQGV